MEKISFPVLFFLNELITDLRDAINRRHIKTLSKAIIAARKSRFSRYLRPNIDAAEDLKAHLETLEMFSHDVLELKQTTISEIENYVHPPKGVINTMQATYLLLGEDPKYLKVKKLQELTILGKSE